MTAKPTDVESHLASVPDDARATLEQLRRTIKAIAPDAVESFSYGLPTFKYQGRPLIYIGAARNHCALYGLSPDAFKQELAAYDTSKGTIRFPTAEPPPEDLIRKLLSARIADIEATLADPKQQEVRSRITFSDGCR